jgi:hypothetical protein
MEAAQEMEAEQEVVVVEVGDRSFS